MTDFTNYLLFTHSNDGISLDHNASEYCTFLFLRTTEIASYGLFLLLNANPLHSSDDSLCPFYCTFPCSYEYFCRCYTTIYNKYINKSEPIL